MSVNYRRLSNDEVVDKLSSDIIGITRRCGVEQDKYDQWFSASQLDNLRKVLEIHGWEVARKYQAGKINQGDHPNETKRNIALWEIIDLCKSAELDLTIISYMIGKLNAVIKDEFKKQGGRTSGK